MCGSNFINQMLDSKYVQPNDLLLLRKTECNLKILNGSSTHFNTSSLPRMKKSTFMNRNDELIQLQGVLALCEFHYCEFRYCGFSKLYIENANAILWAI